MPGTTPNLGLQYALGTDNVSGYPAAVDQPAKTTMDGWSLLTSVSTNTTSQTISRGQSVIASPSTTQTLPAASANAMVAVTASSTVTGATPVTVAGTRIYGVGLNNATSFILGAPGAVAVLQSDGTNWFVVGGGPSSVLSTNTSVTAVVGQTVITTGSSAVTVTLPAATAGAEITVENRSTGGTTVSGSNIQGVGLSSASSFPLGTVGATATLLADGTNWNMIAGQQDSGWVQLSLVANINSGGSYTPAVRRVGDRCWFSGQVVNGTGGTINGTVTFATLPSSTFYPASAIWDVLVARTDGSFGQFTIASGAAAVQTTFSWANGIGFSLEGLSYRVV